VDEWADGLVVVRRMNGDGAAEGAWMEVGSLGGDLVSSGRTGPCSGRFELWQGRFAGWGHGFVCNWCGKTHRGRT